MTKEFVPLKIGVLTLPLNQNIGGNIQAYALMETLRQLGHEPELINRRHQSKDSGPDVVDLIKDAERPLYSNTINMGRDVPNTRFIQTHMLPITRPFNWSPQLRRHIDRYQFDAIIVGSDQVWRPRYAQSMLHDSFLGFIPNDSKIKRISYAASFGTQDWEFDAQQTEEFSKLIRKFDAVSVREDSGVALCQRYLGVSSEHVLDPTLLLQPEHYIQKFSLDTIHSEKNRLLSYILDASGDKTRVIDTIAVNLSLNTYGTNGLPVGSPVTTDGEGEKSIENWLASFHHADFVVTDSFHGTVFSILFNKPFIAYGNPNRGMARFTSLLKMVGLEDRLVVRSSEVNIDKMLQPIDWKTVNQRLDTLRIRSFDFLKSALSQDTKAFNIIKAHPRFKVDEVNAHPLKVLCSGCGACVSESNGSLSMSWNNDGFLVPEAHTDNIPNDAIKVCPFNPNPEKTVEDEDALASIFLSTTKKSDLRIGRFENTYVGYSKRFRPTSSSGGIATYVLEKLLNRGHVDYLYVVQKDGDTGYRYQSFHKGEDIFSISKTRYFPVSLDQLFSTIEQTDGRVAVTGVPCFLKAIRLKQYYHPELKKKIPFLLGIICGGLKSRHYTDFLAQCAGISGAYTQPEYRVKDENSTANNYLFSALDSNSKPHNIKMTSLGDMWGTGMFKARVCDFCTDVLAELADISLGDAWLPEYKSDGLGNSIIVTRSQLAEQLIQSGIQDGELVLDSVSVNKVVQSQGGGISHRHTGIKFRVWLAKNYTDLSLPVIRTRLQKSIEPQEALVQILRERTRLRSLNIWKETRHTAIFRARMGVALRTLKYATDARRNRYDGTLDPVLVSLLTANKPNVRLLMQKLSKEHRPAIRWLMNLSPGNNSVLQKAFKDGVIVAPQVVSGTPTVKKIEQDNSQILTKKVVLTKSKLAEFPDVTLWMVNALDVYEATGGKFVSPNNNIIAITDVKDKNALRNTNIYFSGKNNKVILRGLAGISKLDIACVDGSSFSIGSPESVRGAVIMASHGSSVTIGNHCLISRDVIMYCSAAHEMYDLDGTHRGGHKNINIGNRVWIGQGARLVEGATVGDNSVIGCYSVLSGIVSNNCAAAGNPCLVTSKNIFWTSRGSGTNLNYFELPENKGNPKPTFVSRTQD